MSEPMRWFPLYLDRFLTSKRVRRMDAQQVGVYFLLLCEQWDNGPIGDDEADLMLVARAEIPIIREVLQACFKLRKKGWINDTLEEIRKEQQGKLTRRSIAGAAGAKARWNKGRNGKRMRKAMRPQSDVDGIREEEKREEVLPRARAREHPLPDSWLPTDKHLELARSRGVDVELEAESFRAHAQTHDRRAANWDAAFRNWLLKAHPPNGNGRPRKKPRRVAPDGTILSA